MQAQATTGSLGTDQEARKRRVLQRSPVFGALDPAVLEEVVRKSALVRVVRRRPIYQEGEQASAIYVLASGRARITRRGRADREWTVAYRGPGDIIGEASLMGPGTYYYSATATEQLEAVRVPSRAVQRLIDTYPMFSARLMRLVLERRLEAENRIEALVTRSVEARVAEFLLTATRVYGVPESRGVLIGVKFTHQEIANYVGSTRETVTLTLGDLKRRGVILFDHRRIVVTDTDALTALA